MKRHLMNPLSISHSGRAGVMGLFRTLKPADQMIEIFIAVKLDLYFPFFPVPFDFNLCPKMAGQFFLET